MLELKITGSGLMNKDEISFSLVFTSQSLPDLIEFIKHSFMNHVCRHISLVSRTGEYLLSPSGAAAPEMDRRTRPIAPCLQVYLALLALLECSDTWGAKNQTSYSRLINYANEEAERRGYEDWRAAYRALSEK